MDMCVLMHIWMNIYYLTIIFNYFIYNICLLIIIHFK